MDTLQIQKNPVKKKALPSNRSPQGDSYCNGSHPVSGAGPSLNKKIRFRTVQHGFDSRIPLHLFFSNPKPVNGLRQNRRNPFHYYTLHSKSIQGIPRHCKLTKCQF